MARWAPYGGAQHTITMTPHSGSYALRQTIATTEGGAYQDVKGLVAGMSYQFRAWVRSETGLVNGSLAVSDTVGNNIAWTGVQSISNTWREFVVTFTATSQGIARIHLVKWDTTGALLWDDVEMPGGATAISGVKMRYYPYGQEVGTATANDVAKFGTYTRDASSGLDYAMNRYYQSTWGRFTTADPYRASGGPGDPGSWNRYSYVLGDPVNYGDPSGLDRWDPKTNTLYGDPWAENFEFRETFYARFYTEMGTSLVAGGGTGSEGRTGGGGSTGGRPPTDSVQWQNPFNPGPPTGDYSDYLLCVGTEWGMSLALDPDQWLVVHIAPLYGLRTATRLVAVFVPRTYVAIAMGVAVAADISKALQIRNNCTKQVYGSRERERRP